MLKYNQIRYVILRYKVIAHLSLVIAAALLLFVVTLGSVTDVLATEDDALADTDGIDEIVVIGTDGFIYVYDYTGEEVYKSSEGGWTQVTTADLNNDGDQEILAVGGNTIKVFDPQVSGTAYEYVATYSGSGGQFRRVAAGNFINGDSTPEIALLRSVGDGTGRIVLYDPPNTAPIRDDSFFTDWQDFAIGDYDGDQDDDFALIYWNDSLASGSKSWIELRKGHDSLQKLDNDDDAGQYSDSQWFDVVSGNLDTGNGNKVEWVGSQNVGDNLIAYRWRDGKFNKIWGRSAAYEFLATADFRAEGADQVVMLRNTSDANSPSLRFLHHAQGQTWAELKGLGTGWLNLAAGNLDTDSTGYREAVILKANLIRVYLVAQGSAAEMDCNSANECLEITGSFNGALAVGDLGVEFEQTIPFEVNPTTLSRNVTLNETVPSTQFSIYGERAVGQPLSWHATALPLQGSAIFKEALARNPNMPFTITPDGLSYQDAKGPVDVPSVPWLILSDYNGTTPATVTIAFSNTFAGSPLAAEGFYEALLIIVRDEPYEARFAEVSVVVGEQKIYLPLIVTD